MSRLLCVWERGGDFGHMSRFLPLALTLRERGHEVVFALKDLSNAEAILGRHGFPLLQAPIWTAPIPGLPKMPLNYTELVCQFGFLNKPGLTGMLKGWRELYGLVKPDLMLADFSPTALLAARGLPFKRALIGTGFCSPPRVSPFPNMRSWLTVPPERLPDGEKNVLQTANAVLAGFGVKPMRALFDLFDADEDFLCTFPELDHYPGRGPVRYWGPAFSTDHGQDLTWPETPGKRVFAYLRPQYRDFEKILGLLLQVKGTVLLFSPGISKAMARKYRSPRMTIMTQPAKLAALLPGCNLVICHAGHGTLAAALLAGVPLMLLPEQKLEQYMAGRRVVQLGAGLMVTLKTIGKPSAPQGPESGTPTDKGQSAEKARQPAHRETLLRLLSNPVFTTRARAFAAAHAGFDQAAQCEAIARRIEEILGR